VRQRQPPNGNDDHDVIGDKDRIVIVLGNRRRVVLSSTGVFGSDVVVDDPMTATMSVACVMVGVQWSVAIRMPRQMEVRPSRMVGPIG
jgi:hypothetical protein